MTTQNTEPSMSEMIQAIDAVNNLSWSFGKARNKYIFRARIYGYPDHKFTGYTPAEAVRAAWLAACGPKAEG